MPNEELIVLRKSEAEEFFLQVLRKHDESKVKMDNSQSLSINQAAKLLHRSHSTIKKLIRTGHLNATSDNRISEAEINRYLAGTNCSNK